MGITGNTFIKDDEACSGADSVTANKRQSSWCGLLVFDVFVTEKIEQSDLEERHESMCSGLSSKTLTSSI